MKTPYTKPMLYAETFELVEHIAGCVISEHAEIGYKSESQDCYYRDKNLVLHWNETACANELFVPGVDGSFSDFTNKLENGGYDCYNAFASGGAFSS